MSIYSTQAFIDLFESGLISSQELEEVHQQTYRSQDDDDIGDAIVEWLKSASRQGIFETYQQKLTEIIAASPNDLNKSLGAFDSKSPTQPNQPSQSAREMLDNAIATPPSSPSPPAKP